MSVNSIEESSTSSSMTLLFMKEPRPHSTVKKCNREKKNEGIQPVTKKEGHVPIPNTLHNAAAPSFFITDSSVDSTNHTFQP